MGMSGHCCGDRLDLVGYLLVGEYTAGFIIFKGLVEQEF